MASAAHVATSVAEICRTQRADGPATVLAIGTANPANCISQDAFPDYYFRVTKSEHHTELKDKFRRLCKQLAAGAGDTSPILYIFCNALSFVSFDQHHHCTYCT
jgi:metal-dependent amidase/aminoacylase/carboxypeptidase family protein